MAAEPLAALRDGRLSDAVPLQESVVNETGGVNPVARLFLVELLILAGRHRDARDHLDAIESDDPAWPRTRRGFRRLVRCARRRERAARPALPADPPAHTLYRQKVCRALKRGDGAAATGWLDRADAATPYVTGHVDGREFEGLRDADDRFASVLEVFAGRDYAWVPWEHVRRLVVRPAEHALDRAFRPARLRLADGSEADVLLPLVYPASFGEDDFALGLETDRAADSDGPVRCVGAKLLLTGEEELTLGECRQIDVRG